MINEVRIINTGVNDRKGNVKENGDNWKPLMRRRFAAIKSGVFAPTANQKTGSIVGTPSK